MAGMLEQLLSGSGFGGPGMTYEAPEPGPDEAALAEEARRVAAKRQKRSVISEPPAFEAPAVPFSGMGMLGAVGSAPQFPVPSVAPDANDPLAEQPQVFKDGVPVPRPRPAEADKVEDVSSQAQTPGAPMSLAPPQAQPQAPAQPGFGSGIVSKIDSILQPQNAPLLLSLAGGFAGAGSIGTGMRRAFSQAAPAAMQNIQLNQKLSGQSATYRAMIAKGVPPQEALAATLNPDVMKAVAAKYFEAKPLQHVMAKGPLGEDIPMVFDQNKGVFLDASGKPLNQDGSGGGALGASGVYAPGVTKIDPSLNGDDMLAQYHPDVQAAVKAYMAGDVMPSGNPRQKTISDLAKRIAIRYGQDMGIPVSDASYQEKLAHRREMASGKAGVGLQRTALRQGLEHLEGATKQALDLGNYSLGLAPLTEGVNAVRGLTDTQKGKVVAFDNKIQTLAGEVGKFFSGPAGGGVHEREMTRNRFKGITSPTVLADAIDSTLELMEGGLHSREQSQQQLFGGTVPSNVQYLTKDDRDRIAHIRELSAQLRKGSAPAAAPAGKTGSGINWSVVQ